MNKKIKVVLGFAGILTAATLSGCATMFGDNDKSVHINSYPQGAQLYVNNNPIGTTPTTITVPNTWSPTLVTIKKPGYQTRVAQINTEFQPVGILNIFFWPGFIIDAIADNMMKISPDSRVINANLSRN